MQMTRLICKLYANELINTQMIQLICKLRANDPINM